MSIYKGNKLIAGGPNGSNRSDRPDWAHAVKLSANTLYLDGYIVPSDGIIVGWFRFTGHIAVLEFLVESIAVARAAAISSSDNSEGNVQCPVNQGNELSLNTREGILTVSNITAEMFFVPYKAQ